MTDTVQEIAFRYAVDKVNHDQKILPRTRLMAQIERIPPHDSFYASKQGKDLVNFNFHIHSYHQVYGMARLHSENTINRRQFGAESDPNYSIV